MQSLSKNTDKNIQIGPVCAGTKRYEMNCGLGQFLSTWFLFWCLLYSKPVVTMKMDSTDNFWNNKSKCTGPACKVCTRITKNNTNTSTNRPHVLNTCVLSVMLHTCLHTCEAYQHSAGREKRRAHSWVCIGRIVPIFFWLWMTSIWRLISRIWSKKT